jgi:hypothetical protein
VAGNINTTGNLMINGVAGTNGQVLGMNGGAMQWMDKSRFKNWALFTSSGTFNVPPGVTEVLIEMWGAGGGGHSPGGGGGSGGYWIGLIPVTGVTAITITVGTGGTSGSGSTAAGDGGNTTFSCTGFNVSTGGGFGADSTLTSIAKVYFAGDGGVGQVSGAIMPTDFRSFYFVDGQAGTPTCETRVQVSSTSFPEYWIGGTGGVAPFSGALPPSSTIFLNTAPTIVAVRIRGGVQTPAFGGGGTPNINSAGSAGGAGRVIIYY